MRDDVKRMLTTFKDYGVRNFAELIGKIQNEKSVVSKEKTGEELAASENKSNLVCPITHREFTRETGVIYLSEEGSPIPFFIIDNISIFFSTH